MAAQYGWQQVNNMLGIPKEDHVWCVWNGVVLTFSIKYNLSWGGCVVTINSSSGGAACRVLHEQKISSFGVSFSSSVSEKEVNVRDIGLVKVRWGPWETHMTQANRPQQVTFLHEGRQLYSCHFESSERKPVPALGEAGKASAPADLIYEALKVRLFFLNLTRPALQATSASMVCMCSIVKSAQHAASCDCS
jgi:hypothetical protein